VPRAAPRAPPCSCAATTIAREFTAHEQALAVGGEAAWLGEILAERIAAWPDERLRRRDAAIVALARICEAELDRGIAARIASKLARYETTRWRRERMARAAPSAHGYEGAALFAVLRASGASGAPGTSTIRRALAAFRAGQDSAIAVGQNETEADFTIDSSPRNPSPKLNAAAKPTELAALATLARQTSTQELLADDRAGIVAERQSHVDAIKVLDAKAEADWPKGQAAIAAAAAQMRDVNRRAV
jgi:hypothetical protein